MTNRELILDYQAVREYAAANPDPVLAKRLETLASAAIARGLADYLDLIHQGFALPAWMIPGYDESRRRAKPAPVLRHARPGAPGSLQPV